MLPFINRLLDNKYLNSWIVLVVDLIVSVGSSFIALFMAGLLFPPRVADSSSLVMWIVGSVFFSLLFFYLLSTYKAIIRYSTLREQARLAAAAIGKGILLFVLLSALPDLEMSVNIIVTLCFDVLLTIVSLMILRISMTVIYGYVQQNRVMNKNVQRLLIYGIGGKGVSLVTQFQNSKNFSVIGFLNLGKRMDVQTLMDYPIYSIGNVEELIRLRNAHNIDSILFPHIKDVRAENDRLVRYCIETGIRILVSPSVSEAVEGKISINDIRNIRIDDLLGREEIKISIDEIQKNFHDKVVMVTGAAGSIGSELCRQLAQFGVKKLVLFDNAETPMHNLRLELEEKFPELDFEPVIGDVRLLQRLDFAFNAWHPQVVFHAAAYKHVPLMEENPCEAVLVNVAGTRNVADKCVEYDVEKMVMVSTDKAVNPTNIMGCTKRLAEIYVQSLGLAIEKGTHPGSTKFVTTRFGNVLDSNGSVIPRFRDQIAKGGPVTVTHPDITRYFMIIPEACRLVMEAATMSTGNQIYVFDMGTPVKISELAKRMIELAGLVPGQDIEIIYTGLRPGEKLYEELLSNSENTIPTGHSRIHIAKVRDYDYDEAEEVMNRLETMSRYVEISDMVRLMKKTVPEYKSNNSWFEELDKTVENYKS